MTLNKTNATVYIDPSHTVYYDDKLFDINSTALNHSEWLLPFVQLRQATRASGVEIHTADFLPESSMSVRADYYSLGLSEKFNILRQRKDVCLRAFIIMEPPVVEPELYKMLPELTAAFELVYLHNVHGNGYSLKGVDATKLRKLYWPQPRQDIIEPYWSNNDRLKKIVVINGNHKPRRVPNELYSKRIEAMAALASTGQIELYGQRWRRWWSRASMWWPYWRHRRSLMSIYKGSCESKYEVLAKYQFSLCFENMAMLGYVTEKIFDCFYAGTIPIYWGAPDIYDLIPKNAYIDYHQFPNCQAMLNYLNQLTEEEILEIKKKW